MRLFYHIIAKDENLLRNTQGFVDIGNYQLDYHKLYDSKQKYF